MNNLSIAVCVLFYEKVKQTVECIKSFLPSGVNIYVLNNNSSWNSRKILGEFCSKYSQIRIIESEINLGVGVGRNHLVSSSKEEWLLFVDNDITIITRDWLDKIKKHIHENDAEVYIPRLFNKHENNYADRLLLIIENNKVLFTPVSGPTSNCFPGGASYINRKLFDRLGLYDDKMFVGLEDFEISIRGVMTGAPINAKIIDDIELIHDHRKAKDKEERNALLSRYNINSLERSFDRIKEKHNLELELDWKPWVTNQVNRMMRSYNFWEKLINKFIPDQKR